MKNKKHTLNVTTDKETNKQTLLNATAKFLFLTGTTTTIIIMNLKKKKTNTSIFSFSFDFVFIRKQHNFYTKEIRMSIAYTPTFLR